jgi:hypothetical protein
VVQPASIDGGPKIMCLLTLERTAAAVSAEGVAAAQEVESVLAGLRALVADRASLVSTPRIVQAAARRPRA